MKRTDNIDWVKIENEYVTGTMSYGDIAASYGISYSCVKDHGLSLGWRSKRAEYRQDCTKKTAEKTAEKISDMLSKMAETQVESALELVRKLNHYIKTAKSLKPREYLQIAQTLRALNAAFPQQKDTLEDDGRYGVVILPARQMIDPPADDPDMENAC